jgi:hypothetical protein
LADPLLVATSKNGKVIRLTETIWRKIQDHHPEFGGPSKYLVAVRDAIDKPDYVVAGWGGAMIALAWNEDAPANPKHLAVVYREVDGDGFVIAAFFISRYERLLKRGVLWQRT